MRYCIFALFVGVFLSVCTCYGAFNNFIDGPTRDHLWTNVANWTDGVPSSSGNIVLFVNQDANFPNIYCVIPPSTNATCSSLYGPGWNVAHTTGVLDINNASLTANYNIYVGWGNASVNDANGIVTQRGGTVSSANGSSIIIGGYAQGVWTIYDGNLVTKGFNSSTISLGQQIGSKGTLTVNGGKVEMDGAFWIGKAGTGIVNITGGVVKTAHVWIAAANGTTGHVQLDGGTLAITVYNGVNTLLKDPILLGKDGITSTASMDITRGVMTVDSNVVDIINAYASVPSPKLTAYGGAGVIQATYDAGTSTTTVTATCPALQGDLTGDCTVNFADVEVLSSQWLDNTAGLKANLIGDARVNFSDFAILAKDWLVSW